MTIESLIETTERSLTRRLERMLGSAEAAEDVRQEAYLRAWRHGPRDAAEPEQRAWLYRTASNLAIDELRRRRLRTGEELAVSQEVEDRSHDSRELAPREVLGRLSAHERLVLLLRFEAGLSHAEIGALLDLSAEATRKRVERARQAFVAAYREAPRAERPLILLLRRSEDDSEPYVDWLERGGARVRVPSPERVERELATADGLVLTGGYSDVDPALYGEAPRAELGPTDPDRDRHEIGALRLALRQDLPVVGICRTHQLLNVALGGSLYQDVERDGATTNSHRGGLHSTETAPGTLARRIIGRRADVASDHHQAIRRLAPGMRVTARSSDGIVEGVELPERRFFLALQWHPEYEASGAAGRRVADALIAAAGAAA